MILNEMGFIYLAKAFLCLLLWYILIAVGVGQERLLLISFLNLQALSLQDLSVQVKWAHHHQFQHRASTRGSHKTRGPW
jgi:hypothetical protein